MMLNAIRRFVRDESAAVTVDWVMITAGIVLFGVAVAVPIRQASVAKSSDVASFIDTVSTN